MELTKTEREAIAKANAAEVDYGAVVRKDFDPNSLTLAQLHHCFIDFGIPWNFRDSQNKARSKPAFIRDFTRYVLPEIIKHQKREAEEATFRSDNKRRSASPLPHAAPRKKVKTTVPRTKKQGLKRQASGAGALGPSKRRSRRVEDLDEDAVRRDPIDREIDQLKESILHTKGARHVAFDIHHEDGASKGYVFFYSSHAAIGGPFIFMSNFFKCAFQVEALASKHVFTSMEQFYQFCKTKSFAIAREFLVELPNGVEISSYQMPQLVLAYDDPMEIAILVRAFVDAGKKKSERWYKEWSVEWKCYLDTILDIGLRAKFDSDQKLKDDLVKTGNYVLAEAAKNDKSCGIGFAARDAFKKRNQWENRSDNNKLGNALMRVRAKYQQEEEAGTMSFDRAYYNELVRKFWQGVHARQQNRMQNKSKSKNKSRKH